MERLMTLKKRMEVWKKCKELWRCVCSMANNPFPCPCPYFLKFKKCKCNNEELEKGHTVSDWVEFNTKNKNKKTKS